MDQIVAALCVNVQFVVNQMKILAQLHMDLTALVQFVPANFAHRVERVVQKQAFLVPMPVQAAEWAYIQE